MYYAPTIVRWHIFLFMERWIDATYIRYIVSILLHHLFFFFGCVPSRHKISDSSFFVAPSPSMFDFSLFLKNKKKKLS